MSNYQWNHKELEKALKTTGVQEIRVAVAFLSAFGVRLLQQLVQQHRLPRTKVQVFLSDQFDSTNPGLLLSELFRIADVFLVDKKKLHAKVLLLKGTTTVVLFGSSNLTAGGWGGNLEFNAIDTFNDPIQASRVDWFFDHCKTVASPVTETVIQKYEALQAKFAELHRTEAELQRQLSRALNDQDPFDVTTYDLSDRYFEYEDYETFFPKYIQHNDRNLAARRQAVQTKLLAIHNIVASRLQGLGLQAHWHPGFITSLTHPSHFNHNRVSWMGVRYADSKRVHMVQAEKQNKSDDEWAYGFYKLACLQFAVDAEGFWISLFHAVAHDAVDRHYLKLQMVHEPFRRQVEHELGKLQGQSFSWKIGDYAHYRDIASLSLDEPGAPQRFADFYRRHDEDGTESFLWLALKPDQAALRTKESIAALIEDHFKRLMPLYNLISDKP